MGKEKVKTIGVIGLGSIGLRHKTNLWKHLGQTEVIGYDPDAAKTQGAGWIIGDLIDLIKMSDAVVIASPTECHYEHLANCILHKKPCFMEKPIADLPMQIEDVRHITMVGYNLRFHPCVIKAKEWIDNDIGVPLWANFTLGQRSIKPPYLRDGVILNWSHEIDLALYLLGAGRVVHSSTRLTDGRDDISDILFNHANGCRSTIHLDYVTRPEVRQTIIVGSKGTVIFDLVNHQSWLRDKDGPMIEHFNGDIVFKPEYDVWNQTYIDEMRAFLDIINSKPVSGYSPLRGCTAEEGLEVLKICLEVRKQAGL
jgi:predicted dehydrogenase